MLISEEITGIAQLVQKKNIGLLIKHDEWWSLDKKLAEITHEDYEVMLSSVLQYRDECSCEHQQLKFDAFMEHVLSDKVAGGM